ncbi:hypothetical protein D3C75_936090 [compost metagenome]
MVPGHGRAGAHALAQRRAGRQRYHHGLRRTGRKVDAAGQRAAITALHHDVHGQRPIHRALQAQGQELTAGPVPHTALRAQAQGRPLGRVEHHAPQHFAFGRLLRVVLRHAGILGRHIDHRGRAHEAEQRLLPSQQGRAEQQGEYDGQGTADHKAGALLQGPHEPKTE